MDIGSRTDQKGMDMSEAQFELAPSKVIRDAAVSLPEVEEGSSCVNRAFKAAGKNFAFLGESKGVGQLRVKLGPSLDALNDRPSDAGGTIEVGKFGWTAIRFDASNQPDPEELRTWVKESFVLLAPKRLRDQV